MKRTIQFFFSLIGLFSTHAGTAQKKSIEQRVDSVLKKMTLQEKIGQWHDTVLTLEFLADQQPLNKPVVAKLNRLKKRQVRSLVSLSADFKCKAVTLAKDRKIGGVKHLSTQ